MADDTYEDVRFADLRTFLVVQRLLSVAATARELKVTPSQVSKAIVRLEQRLGQRLLARSSKGVALTPSGRRLVPQVQALLTRFEQLRSHGKRAELELTFAAEPYLLAICFPILAGSLPGVSLLGIAAPQALLRARMADNVFDLTIVGADSGKLPGAWSRDAIGTMRKGLFATPKRAAQLGAMPIQPSALRDVPFIMPLVTVGTEPTTGDDGCPLSPADRRIGHQTISMAVALDAAVESDQVTFGPAASARRYVESGLLVEVRVAGWDIREDLFLAYNAERVRKRTRDAFLSHLREVLLAAISGKSTR